MALYASDDSRTFESSRCVQPHHLARATHLHCDGWCPHVVTRATVTMPTIVFVRHAQSEYNAVGRIQGQIDCPLDDVGRAQLIRGAPEVGRHHADARAVYASDLSRARDTARAIADVLGVEVIEDARVRERHLGALQGMSGGDAARLAPEARAAWRSRDIDARVPGGGETSRELDARVRAFFRSIVSEYEENDKVICVTHGGVLGWLFRRGVNGDEKKLCGMRRGVGNLAECVVRVTASDDGAWRCVYETWASGKFLEETTRVADDVAS